MLLIMAPKEPGLDHILSGSSSPNFLMAKFPVSNRDCRGRVRSWWSNFRFWDIGPCQAMSRSPGTYGLKSGGSRPN